MVEITQFLEFAMPQQPRAIPTAFSAAEGRIPGGFTWRHAATVLLLVMTLPVFGVAAVVALPVLAAVGSIELVRRALQAMPSEPGVARQRR